MYRTFRKPLGYAGDYEMVNMMLRDPIEGGSLFAKLLNTFFLATPPVIAHQNRIQYLIEFLKAELADAWAERRQARVFNIGCGPAREIQDLLIQSEVSNHGHFTLLDFNDETIQHTRKTLTELIQRHERAAEVNLVRKSVGQLLKEEARNNSAAIPSHFDIVYCAGLYDYIPQKLCQQLTSLFYRMLRPGGLMVVTNVAACNPSRHWMELCVDWHLVYRNAEDMKALIPATANREHCRLLSDESGVNSFLEVRKPRNG
jgi:extracellular factor (EF) 3-hydroxypalmitic acid methyl ester biosynthesis protein